MENTKIKKNGEVLMRRADLFDYIEAIGEFKIPPWDNYHIAHRIRDKRNRVHARVCIREDDVNEESCREVIDYLNGNIAARKSIFVNFFAV